MFAPADGLAAAAAEFVPIRVLSPGSRFRRVFCEQMTFGHLAEAVHRVVDIDRDSAATAAAVLLLKKRAS